MPPIPAGYAEAVYKIASPDVTDGFALTTVGLKLSTALNSLTAAEVANAFDTEIWSHDGNESYVYESCTVQDATTAFVIPNGSIGPGTGVAAPPNTALLLKKLSGLRGRANRGRMYLPGVLDRETIRADGSISGVDLGNYQDHVTNWQTTTSGATGVTDLVILHADGVTTPTPVVFVQVESIVATQRRRLRK
jgi:hypothetical protein